MNSVEPLIGAQLGDYRIVDLLGRGGMARVYKGYDAHLDRYAAVKVIDAALNQEDESAYQERFQREARAIARLHHPNIVGVYQFGQRDSLYYMAMEFIEGRDLGHILKEQVALRQLLPHEVVLRIARDIGAALDHAHAENVIHRDVKPSNIMVRPDGQAVLTDFGLALNVPEGTIGNTFGSAHYIAPEQAVSSARAVPQSDLYSLGVVLFQILVGKVPFDDASAMTIALKHLSEPPPSPCALNPALTPNVEQVLLRALAKSPDSRYPNCHALVLALADALGMDLADTRRTPPSRPVRPLAVQPSAEPLEDRAATRILPPSQPDRPTTRPARAGFWGFAVIGLIVVVGLIALMSRREAPSTALDVSVTETLLAAALVEVTEPPATAARTRTPASTHVVTAVPTQLASASVVDTPVAIAPTVDPVRAPLLLLYDDRTLVLVNRTSQALDVSGLTFTRNTTSGATQTFRSNEWPEARSLGAGSCFQVWTSRYRELQPPDQCRLSEGWRAISSTRAFWISDTVGAAFNIQRGDDLLATCFIAEGLCGFSLDR